MQRYLLGVFSCFLALFSAFGQQYSSPLNIPLVLAANFGELRTNHFHMGLDFKTNGKEGLEIKSIADGFISRIKISPYGYGKAVYIDHPDGRTSVYAHCRGFVGKADSLVKEIQQREESAEVDIYFTKEDLPVKRGQLIAFSGNTGRSSAPHLHFEIRDTKTGDALNPLQFGFQIADHRVPAVQTLKVCSLDEHGFPVPQKEMTVKLTKSGTNTYTVNGGITVPAHWCSDDGGIGLSVHANDYFDAADNSCGIFETELRSNGVSLHHMQLDRVAFEHSRYINSHMDHAEFLKGKDVHRLFHSTENPLGIYQTGRNGIIGLRPGESKKIEIEVRDYARNAASIQFQLSAAHGQATKTDVYNAENYFLPHELIVLNDSENRGVVAEIQPHTLYTPIKKDFSLDGQIRIGNCNTPVQKPIKLIIPSKKEKQLYLETCTEKGGKGSVEMHFLNGAYLAFPKNLGTYTVKKDLMAPRISFLGIRAGIISWSVKEYETEIIDYDLFINGQWVLLEYESKKDLLFARLPLSLPPNSVAEVRVRDLVGNEQVLKIDLK